MEKREVGMQQQTKAKLIISYEFQLALELNRHFSKE
jgi:hypothetical protein